MRTHISCQERPPIKLFGSSGELDYGGVRGVDLQHIWGLVSMSTSSEMCFSTELAYLSPELRALSLVRYVDLLLLYSEELLDCSVLPRLLKESVYEHLVHELRILVPALRVLCSTPSYFCAMHPRHAVSIFIQWLRLDHGYFRMLVRFQSSGGRAYDCYTHLRTVQSFVLHGNSHHSSMRSSVSLPEMRAAVRAGLLRHSGQLTHHIRVITLAGDTVMDQSFHLLTSLRAYMDLKLRCSSKPASYVFFFSGRIRVDYDYYCRLMPGDHVFSAAFVPVTSCSVVRTSFQRFLTDLDGDTWRHDHRLRAILAQVHSLVEHDVLQDFCAAHDRIFVPLTRESWYLDTGVAVFQVALGLHWLVLFAILGADADTAVITPQSVSASLRSLPVSDLLREGSMTSLGALRDRTTGAPRRPCNQWHGLFKFLEDGELEVVASAARRLFL